ncbi:MAG TPA: cellulase family glycosylhydrolase [Terracidiphilus sp.]|jgi:hypothetical protein|nr:cellulase family glycosylhydrolase [Terracidiphilus sp.]
MIRIGLRSPVVARFYQGLSKLRHMCGRDAGAFHGTRLVTQHGVLPLLGLGLLMVSTAGALTPNQFTWSQNGHYWLKNGAPFITIGYNRYDVWNPSDPANEGLTTTQYVQRMSQYGVNVIRVWAEQGDPVYSPNFWLEDPAGTYDSSQISRLDELFNAADQYGVYVEICPWDTWNIKNNFQDFPYNTANGGMISSPAAMITNPTARQYIKNKIQFIYGRWGAHPSFFLWTFNEINTLDTNNTDQLNFAQDIGNYIKSIDPYHPFTISYTGSGQGYVPLEQLSQIGGSDIHFYGAISGTGSVAKEYNTAINIKYLDCCGKPLLLTEWGDTTKYNQIDIVNATNWGAIPIGLSGNGMIWTDQSKWGPVTIADLQLMHNLSNFTASINWSTFMDSDNANSSVSTSSHGVAPYACKDATQAIVLLVASVGNSTATTLTVNGLQASHSYTIDIWQTYNYGKYGSVIASTNSSGQLIWNSPNIATMQALYIH